MLALCAVTTGTAVSFVPLREPHQAISASQAIADSLAHLLLRNHWRFMRLLGRKRREVQASFLLALFIWRSQWDIIGIQNRVIFFFNYTFVLQNWLLVWGEDHSKSTLTDLLSSYIYGGGEYAH